MKIEIKIPKIVDLKDLIPNPWNPNKVAKPELNLLELSILKSGFCFPIVVIEVKNSISEKDYFNLNEHISVLYYNHLGEYVIDKDLYSSDIKYIIVDGFHRHLIAKKLKMESIPVVILDDNVNELMNATIRFNRAKGTHQIDRMSNIIAEKIKLGSDVVDIMNDLGMDADEVLRLKQDSGIAEIFGNKDYSNSWDVKK